MSAATQEFNELMRDKERRTAHPDDDRDDAQSFLNLSDDEENDSGPAASHTQYDDNNEPIPRASTTYSRNTIPTTRYQANTGPKGVIADAQNFRDSRRSRRISLRSSSNLQAQLADRKASQVAQQQVYSEKLAESDGELDEDDEDDDFMREWRQNRLKQMQDGPREGKINGGGEKRRRLYGGLVTVDGSGYLDAVDNSPEDIVVVVYIYDDYVSSTPSITRCKDP